MPTIETIRLLTVKGRPDGLDRLATELGRVSDAQREVARTTDTVVQSTDTLSRKQISVTAAWEKQQARTDAAVRAQQDFDRGLRLASQAYDVGTIKVHQYADEITRLKTALQNAGTVGLKTGSISPETLIGTKAVDQGSARASAEAMQEALEAQEQMRREANALLARVDPLAHAQSAYNVELLRYKELLDAGAISARTFSAAQEVAKAKLDQINRTYGGDKTANTSKLAATQFTNLGYQANDIISGLAMGQSPLTILTQQGGQVYQALASAQGGVVGGIKAVGASLAGLVTPVRLAGAGLLAAATEGYLAWSRFDDQQRALTVTLLGVGRNVGLTATQFTAMASAAGAAGDISIKSAIDLGSALAATGKIGADNIGALIRLSKNFAATFGTDISGAKDQLAGIFGSLQGIETFDQKMNVLDARTRQEIRNYFAAGDAQKGIALAIDRTNAALVPHEQAVSRSGSAWEKFKKVVSDADQALGSAINRLSAPLPVAEQLAKAKQDLEGMQTPKERAPWDPKTSFVAPTAPTVASTSGSFAEKLGQDADAARKKVAELQTQYDEMQKATETRARETQIAQLSKELQDYIRIAPTGSKEANDLAVGLMLVNKAASDPKLAEAITSQKEFASTRDMVNQALRSGLGIAPETIKSTTDLTIALEQANQANRNYLDPAQKRLALDKLDQESLVTRSAAGQADIARRRAEIEAAGQMADPVRAATLARNQEVAVLAQAKKAFDDDIYNMHRENEAYGLVGAAREVATQLIAKETQYRSQNMQLSAGQIETLRREIEAKNQLALVQAQLDKLFTDYLAPARDLINVTEAAGKMFAAGAISAGQYAEAINNAKVKALEAQGTLSGGLQAGLLKTGQEFADVSKGMESLISSSATTISGSLTDMAMGTKSTKDAFADMAASIARSMTEMTIKALVLGPLMKSLQSAIGGFGFGGGSGEGDSSGFGGVTLEDGAWLMHSGGMVGAGSSGWRNVHPAYFDDAPRYARGGIAGFAPNEVPIVAHRGEEILTTSDPRHRANGGLGGGGASLTVNIINKNGSQVDTKQSDDGQGGINFEAIIDDAVSRNLSTPGKASNRTLRSNFGAQQQLTRRG